MMIAAIKEIIGYEKLIRRFILWKNAGKMFAVFMGKSIIPFTCLDIFKHLNLLSYTKKVFILPRSSKTLNHLLINLRGCRM